MLKIRLWRNTASPVPVRLRRIVKGSRYANTASPSTPWIYGILDFCNVRVNFDICQRVAPDLEPGTASVPVMPPLFLNTPDIGSHVDIITPLFVGKPLFIGSSTPFFSTKTEFIPVSFTTYRTSDRKRHFFTSK
jgi:hypothetical protein